VRLAVWLFFRIQPIMSLIWGMALSLLLPSLKPKILKCLRKETFYYLIWKSFQNDEEWRLFYCDSTLGCRVIQDFVGFITLDDLWRRSVNTKWCQVTKYGISLQILSLRSWCVARTTHFDGGYDVTIATYHYQTSTFPKWKLPHLLLQRLTDFLVLVLCNVHIRSHPLSEQQVQN